MPDPVLAGAHAPHRTQVHGAATMETSDKVWPGRWQAPQPMTVPDAAANSPVRSGSCQLAVSESSPAARRAGRHPRTKSEGREFCYAYEEDRRDQRPTPIASASRPAPSDERVTSKLGTLENTQLPAASAIASSHAQEARQSAVAILQRKRTAAACIPGGECGIEASADLPRAADSGPCGVAANGLIEVTAKSP